MLGIADDIVFLCTLCAMSENRRFDYEKDGLVLGLADKIKFTKDINIALINF